MFGVVIDEHTVEDLNAEQNKNVLLECALLNINEAKIPLKHCEVVVEQRRLIWLLAFAVLEKQKQSLCFLIQALKILEKIKTIAQNSVIIIPKTFALKICVKTSTFAD